MSYSFETMEQDRIAKIMKNVFLPDEDNPNQLSCNLNYDAQKACEKAAIRIDDLIERTKEEF